MAKRQVKVTVQIDGTDIACGTLNQNVRNNRETLSFSYASSYLSNPNAFALSPDLPLGAGSFHSIGMVELRAFGDCMPDRWGRNLMRREEARIAKQEARAPRTLFELDMLCGVNDAQRQGAIRLWDESGSILTPTDEGAPREVDLPHLLDAADLAADDLSADIHDLFAAGSSLGGARPKASVRNGSGNLFIAKFPRKDESKLDDVCAWEKVALEIFSSCGLVTPESKLLRIAGRSVLLVERFDRDGEKRIPYLSGLSAIRGCDGAEGYSYLDLADFLAQEGANATADRRALWAHALLSAAIGNTDNHMRNFGFMRGDHGWRLAPFFDVNPTSLSNGSRFAVCIADDGTPHSVASAMELCELFDVSTAEAKEFAQKSEKNLATWKRVASACGITEASQETMRPRIEQGLNELSQAAEQKSAT